MRGAKTALRALLASQCACVNIREVRSSRLRCAASAAGRKAPTLLRPAADEERSHSAPSCYQGVGPRHARLRLRVAAVPLRALDSGRCVAPWEVSAPEECRSLSHQRNARVMEGGHPPALLAIPDDAEALKSLLCLGNDRCQKIAASMKHAVFKGF